MSEKGKGKEAGKAGEGCTDSIAMVFKNGNENEPETITKSKNNTPFKIGWHPTDTQQGYYEVVESKGWVNVCDDSILGNFGNDISLQEFNRMVKEFMKENAIVFYIVICRSSNPSSSSYDLFVEEKNKAKMAGVMKI